MDYVEQEYRSAMMAEILGWIQRPFTIMVMLWIQSFAGGYFGNDGFLWYIFWVPIFINLFGICSLPIIVFWIPSYALAGAGVFIMPIAALLSVKAQIENWQKLARLSEMRNRNVTS